MFNNAVYKCDLLSITPDIVVHSDKGIRDNIMNADTNIVANIIVKKTIREDYVREVLTNKLIPIYYVTKFETTTRNNGRIVYNPPKSPIFIKVNKVVGNEGLILETDLENASIDELRTYAFDHLDIEKYKEKLDSYFKDATEYYNNSKAKGVVSEDMQIKRMIKAIKMNRKI